MRTILLHIFDDEELLTRPDQAQFAARDVLDRLWIFSELPGLLAQLRVVLARPDERRFKQSVLLPRLEHGEEPAVADERVDDEDAADRDNQIADNPAAPPAGLCGGRRAGVARPLLHEVVAE